MTPGMGSSYNGHFRAVQRFRYHSQSGSVSA
jgi:hypothetical protein